ncbi:MAG: DUF4364 family protein [Clostridiales bacterium]|nr:DUF4364 family protein [Clostridiales bacterium]
MKKLENTLYVRKLYILYLLYTMDMQMSNSQLDDFAAKTELMDYFALRECIGEMTEAGLLKDVKMNNQTYYSITDEGAVILKDFRKTHLSEEICGKINAYILKNKKQIKEEVDVSANIFFDAKTGFTVKCALYEGDAILMEVNLSVVDKDVSEHICRKWKKQSSELYDKFFNELSGDFAALSKQKKEA